MALGFLHGYPGLGILVAGHVAAGAVAGAAFGPDKTPGSWLDSLHKPAFYPPEWTFPVVWTILYALMGVAAWLALRAGQRAPLRLELFVYILHLVVNLAFSPLFFGLKSTFLGMVDAAALWVLLVAVILLFAKLSGLAALLLAPYLCWVSFALYLSVSLWRLNPQT